MSILSFIVAILILLPSATGDKTVYWDDLLDKYEALCNACLEKRSKKEIQVLSDNINELLKHPQGRMDNVQRARFASIQNKYRGVINFSEKSIYEDEMPRVIRTDTVRRYEHIRITDTVFVKEILGSVELNQHVSKKDTIYHIIQYQFPALPEAKAESSETVTSAPEVPAIQKSERPKPERPACLILGNAAIGSIYSFGATIGALKKWGGYASFDSNFNFNKITPAYSCTSDGKTGGNRIMANGETSRSGLSVTAGVVYEISRWLVAYAGGGYGSKSVLWQDIDGNWMQVSDLCIKGAEFEVGGIFHFGIFGISLGVRTTRFRNAEFKAGLGVLF